MDSVMPQKAGGSAAAEPVMKVERVGRVLHLTMNSPQNMNALSGGIKSGLEEHIPAAIADPDIRVVVLTGTGKAFCAGGDIKGMSDRTPLNVRTRMQGVYKWAQAILESETILITAVNGAAVGAGLGIALLGDIVMASDKAFFMGGFAAIGAIPDIGLGYTLPRAVGWHRAKDILMSNRRIPADEAERMGIATRLVPADELTSQAADLARQLAASPWCVGAMKTLTAASFTANTHEYFTLEGVTQAMAFNTEDFAEGVDAFLNKRTPSFQGR